MSSDQANVNGSTGGGAKLEQYRRMVNTMMESAAVYAQDYTFEVVNEHLAEWYGRPAEALTGQRSNLLPLIEDTSEGQPVRELLRGDREYVEGEIEGEFPGHGHVVLDYRLTALRNDDDRDKFVAVTRDITDRKRKERNLRETMESYRDLFHGINDAVFVHGLDGNFLAVNDTACERLGYSASELERLSPADLDAPGLAEIAPERIATIEKKGTHSFESVHVTKSGDHIPVDISSTAIEYFGEDAILSVARDISDRKAQEGELEKMRRAVEEAGVAIFITDETGTIEYVNPAFEMITGYAAAEAIGRNPRILQSGELDEEYYARMWGAILDGEVWQEEIPNRRKSGELYFAIQTIAPVPQGGESKFVGIQQDITDRKEREQHLQVFNRVLRHNHRNLLNLIMGTANSLNSSSNSTDSHLIGILQQASAELHGISEKAFTMTQVLMDEKRHVEITRFDADVESLVAEFEARYPNADFATQVDRDISFPAHPQFRRCLRELLENAIEHADSADVSVSVFVEETPTAVYLTVLDDGPGIPEDEYQVITGERDLTQIHHGSGLGLWLTYWIVRRSGGELYFDVSDAGTSVRIELPLESAN